MGRAFEVRKQSMAKTAAKKSKIYARYGREIYIAAKGMPDPEINIELKRILERARKDQVPKDVIERAIEKAKGGTGEDYTATRYEFIGPGGSLFIVECLTDNVTRTIHEVRACFTKTGGKSASVLHMFEHKSVLGFTNLTEEQVLESLINNDLDVEDLETEEGQLGIISEDVYKRQSNISEHISNIFAEGELDKNSVVRKFRITATDGKNYNVMHYNLDMIISLGYRISNRII